jgi:SNF2 family DNA or RNA helicase
LCYGDITKAVKQIGEAIGSTRISLSGTPVENKLADLHSQFEFILPGYLGTCT